MIDLKSLTPEEYATIIMALELADTALRTITTEFGDLAKKIGLDEISIQEDMEKSNEKIG